MLRETRIRFLGALAGGLVLLCSGCAVDVSCDEPEPYQAAMEVPRVEPPEGFDSLATTDEMQIPRASPRDPRPPGSPCLDIPPTVVATQSENADQNAGQNADQDVDQDVDDSADDNEE